MSTSGYAAHPIYICTSMGMERETIWYTYDDSTLTRDG